jgi:ligand-binding sensor domain-containing protein
MAGGTVTRIPLGDDPLTGNVVRTVFVDATSVVWAGTGHLESFNHAGVVRFDGTDWIVLSQANVDVPGGANAIEMDEAGNVFVAGESGLWKFNGASWTNFHGPGGGGLNTDIAIEPSGIAWVSTPFAFLYRCPGGSSTQFHPFGFGSNFVYSVEVDPAENIWAGGNGRIGRKDELDNWTIYDGTNALPYMGFIHDIEFDANGDLWAAGNDLIHFDGTTWSVVLNPWPEGFMTDLEFDQHGNIWAGFGNGVGYYDGSSWTVYDNINTPFIENYVVEIALDTMRHRLWCATYGGGLMYLEDEDLITGIADQALKAGTSGLKMYPNPSSGPLTIQVRNADLGVKTLVIRGPLGNLLYTTIFSGPSIDLDLSGYANGLYYAQVVGRGHSHSAPFVIEGYGR